MDSKFKTVSEQILYIQHNIIYKGFLVIWSAMQ